MIYSTSALSNVPRALFTDLDGNPGGAPGKLEITYDLDVNDNTQVLVCTAQIGLY